MKLVLFGATGATGREVLFQALDRGHEVRAVARRPEALTIEHPRLEVEQGDLLDPGSVVDAVAGMDAVVNTTGTGGLMTARRPTRLYSKGTEAIAEAMRSHGVQRLVCITSAGVEDDPTEPWFYKQVIKRVIRATYEDMARGEAVLQEYSDLDWIAVRPPRLTGRPRTGQYRVSRDVVPTGGFEIGRADLAEFVLQQLVSDEHVRYFPTIGY